MKAIMDAIPKTGKTFSNSLFDNRFVWSWTAAFVASRSVAMTSRRVDVIGGVAELMEQVRKRSGEHSISLCYCLSYLMQLPLGRRGRLDINIMLEEHQYAEKEGWMQLACGWQFTHSSSFFIFDG